MCMTLQNSEPLVYANDGVVAHIPERRLVRFYERWVCKGSYELCVQEFGEFSHCHVGSRVAGYLW